MKPILAILDLPKKKLGIPPLTLKKRQQLPSPMAGVQDVVSPGVRASADLVPDPEAMDM